MKKYQKKESINDQGITIIALIISLIVILILAGVSLGGIFNSDDLIKKTSKTTEKYIEAQAREVLETVLMEHATTEKYTNSLYNENDFLDELIKEKIAGTDENGEFTLSDHERSYPRDNDYVTNTFRGHTVGEQYTGSVVYQIIERASNNYEDIDNWYYRKISSREKKIYSKGTTSYGTVTSISPIAHKSGERNSDGFWYESIAPQ